MFKLYEELLLLSIHENKSTFIRSSYDRMKPGLAGAILSELALMERIQVSSNHRLHLAGDEKAEDEILNDIIVNLKASEKERKFGTWVSSFLPRIDKVRKKITENLISKGAIKLEDDNLTWVVPSPINPEYNASTKYWLNERLRGIVLAQKETQPRDIALLSLLRACSLLDLTFLRDERKLASNYINTLVVNEALKSPVIQTVQEIESAIAAVVEED